MPVIAVVNRKGGSGKSTLAAHLAAWYAHHGKAVLLGDIDRQQSTRKWLRRRSSALPAIAPWVIDSSNVLRVPAGITHAVLDTPGGLHGFDLARMVMFSDAIIMPICNSAFDRESAAACHAELMTLPRVASGRCRLACIGMRIDARTRGAETLSDWAAELGLPYLGALRETQLYVQCLERGMTIFDLSSHRATSDLAQWEPLLDWLMPLFTPVRVDNNPAIPSIIESNRVGSSLNASLRSAQQSMVHGDRLFGNRGDPTEVKYVRTPSVLDAARQFGPGNDRFMINAV
jgi:chromosome partitioning protein